MRRRDFLKASAAGAGATLIEGCTEPEEQTLVQPATRPGVLQGESVWQPGVCQQCAAGCGIQVRVVDGNAKKIEGNPAHPVNRGGVCALGHSLLQELYNPDRIITPQRLTGSRGEGLFETTSWDDALSQISTAISGTDPERVAIVAGDRFGFPAALWTRLAAALETAPPTLVEPLESQVERTGAQIALGIPDLPYFDLTRSDYVLSIGAPLIDRWRSPVHYARALAEMRQGRLGRRGKLVQAEARMSLTAAKADEWLAPRPGTEGVLARTIAGVWLRDGLVAEPGRTLYGRLFADEAPSLEEGATLCDLDPRQLQRIAEEMAAAENALVAAGGSAAAQTNGVFNVVAALGLNLLLDNLGRPGGVFAPVSFNLADGLADGAGVGSSEVSSVVGLAERLRGDSGPPVDVLIVADGDPLHTVPPSFGLREGLANVGTVVRVGSFLDDTALHSDLILPVSSELEHFSAVAPGSSVGVPVLSLSRPAVEPLGESRHPAEVVLALAATLGDAVAARFPWSSFEALVQERIGEALSTLPDVEGASASAYLSQATSRGGIFGDELPGSAPPGPSGAAPALAEGRFDGGAADFPFHLLPFESLKHGSGRGANRPWLQEMPDPFSTVMWNGWVELAPADGAALGVTDGDRVQIVSNSGSVEVHVVLDPTVRPGVVGMPLGYGHQQNGRYAAGRGANALDLVAALQVDGASASAWAATRVSVRRLGPGELVRFGRSYSDRGEGELIPVGWAPQETRRESSV